MPQRDSSEARVLASTGKWLFSAAPQVQGIVTSPPPSPQEKPDENAESAPKGLSGSMLAQKRAKREKGELSVAVATEISAPEAEISPEDPFRPLGGKGMFSGINWQVHICIGPNSRLILLIKVIRSPKPEWFCVLLWSGSGSTFKLA